MTKTIENFLRYVKIDTQSSEESTTIPSTMKQHDLARQLVRTGGHGGRRDHL